MAFRPKPTREFLERIVANYRQTGDVTNAAIRSGMDRSTVYRWLAQGEKAKSGALRDFCDALTRAREEDIAFDVMRHKQVAHGGVFDLPVHDKNGRLVKKKNEETGEMEQLYEKVVLLPNRQALETRLRWKDPDRYPGNSSQVKVAVETQVVSSESARPLDLQEMFLGVTRRLAALGIEFKPAVETTAKPVKPEPEMGG